MNQHPSSEGRDDRIPRKGNGDILHEYRTVILFYYPGEDVYGPVWGDNQRWLNLSHAVQVQTPFMGDAVDILFMYYWDAVIAGPLGVTCTN